MSNGGLLLTLMVLGMFGVQAGMAADPAALLESITSLKDQPLILLAIIVGSVLIAILIGHCFYPDGCSRHLMANDESPVVIRGTQWTKKTEFEFCVPPSNKKNPLVNDYRSVSDTSTETPEKSEGIFDRLKKAASGLKHWAGDKIKDMKECPCQAEKEASPQLKDKLRQLNKAHFDRQKAQPDQGDEVKPTESDKTKSWAQKSKSSQIYNSKHDIKENTPNQLNATNLSRSKKNPTQLFGSADSPFASQTKNDEPLNEDKPGQHHSNFNHIKSKSAQIRDEHEKPNEENPTQRSSNYVPNHASEYENAPRGDKTSKAGSSAGDNSGIRNLSEEKHRRKNCNKEIAPTESDKTKSWAQKSKSSQIYNSKHDIKENTPNQLNATNLSRSKKNPTQLFGSADSPFASQTKNDEPLNEDKPGQHHSNFNHIKSKSAQIRDEHEKPNEENPTQRPSNYVPNHASEYENAPGRGDKTSKAGSSAGDNSGIRNLSEEKHRRKNCSKEIALTAVLCVIGSAVLMTGLILLADHFSEDIVQLFSKVQLAIKNVFVN